MATTWKTKPLVERCSRCERVYPAELAIVIEGIESPDTLDRVTVLIVCRCGVTVPASTSPIGLTEAPQGH